MSLKSAVAKISFVIGKILKIGKRSADSESKRVSDRFSGKKCMAWLCTCKRMRVVEVEHNYRVQSNE